MTGTSSNDTRTWCEERLRRPHEPLRLARLFTPPAWRAATTAIGALYIELEAIARGQRDLNVARMKLGWWREELARLDEESPAHPATRLLAGSNAAPVAGRLIDLVTCMELSLLEGSPDSPIDAAQRAERNGSQLVATLNAALQPRNAADDESGMPRLGRAISLVRMLPLRLPGALRDEMVAQARRDLLEGCARLPECVPAVRVLAVLAWDRIDRPDEKGHARSGNDRLRIVRAWRAARGKYPRSLRKRMQSGRHKA